MPANPGSNVGQVANLRTDCQSVHPGAARTPTRSLDHLSAATPSEAPAHYRKILRQDPGNPQALHRLGLLTRQQGHHEKALDLLLRAAKLLPDSAQIQSDVATTLAAARNFLPAIQRFELALSLDP